MDFTRKLKAGLFCGVTGPALLTLAGLAVLALARNRLIRRAGCLCLGLFFLPLLLLARVGLFLGPDPVASLNTLFTLLLPGKPVLTLENPDLGRFPGLSFRAGRLGLRFEERPQAGLEMAGIALTMDLGALILGRGLFARASVQSASAAGVSVSQLETEVDGRSGRIVADTALRVFSGRFVERDVLELGNGPVRWNLDAGAHGVSLAEVREAGFMSPWLEGVLGGRVSLNARGRTLADILASLKGTGEFSLKDGLAAGLVEVIPGLEALALPGTLRLNTVSGGFLLENGIVRNNDLVIESAYVRGTGAGTVDLAGNAVDYGLRLETAAGLASFAVEVSGPLNAGRFRVRRL